MMSLGIQTVGTWNAILGTTLEYLRCWVEEENEGYQMYAATLNRPGSWVNVEVSMLTLNSAQALGGPMKTLSYTTNAYGTLVGCLDNWSKTMGVLAGIKPPDGDWPRKEFC